MKINIAEKVLNYEGKPLELPKEEGKENEETKFLTWKDVIFRSINSVLQDEPLQTAEVKMKIHQINLKLFGNNEPDFTVTERSFILERIDKIEGAMVVGFAHDYFEEKPDILEEKQEVVPSA